MPRSLWLALPLLTVIALGGCAPVPPPEAPSPPPAPEAASPEEQPTTPPAPAPAVSADQAFVNQATGMSNAQIGMGRLAEGKGATKSVRLLARDLVDHHSAENRRLTMTAKRSDLAVAPPPDDPPPELVTSIGPEFDKKYLGLVITGHQGMIALFESEAKDGQSPYLKHYAASVLPLLRRFLHDAQALAPKTGG